MFCSADEESKKKTEEDYPESKMKTDAKSKEKDVPIDDKKTSKDEKIQGDDKIQEIREKDNTSKNKKGEEKVVLEVKDGKAD